MAAEYQQPDARVADYDPYVLDERIIDPSRSKPLMIRGPRPARLDPGGYFVCLGAAQTFGRFVAQPFPDLLSQRLGLPCLNISHGGAGPMFFAQDDGALMGWLNNARFVVVQAMSGRSESNSLFESQGVGSYVRRSDGVRIGCDAAFEALLRERPRREVARIVAETRANWVASCRKLIGGIRTPKIFFWFSVRRPHYREGYGSLGALFGAYPQLVNAPMAAAARAMADHGVECVSRRGSPHPLLDRTTGEPVTVVDPWTVNPWTENGYYPSPEMHDDAARALEPACRVFAGLTETAPCVT
jgi:hypothetical protein